MNCRTWRSQFRPLSHPLKRDVNQQSAPHVVARSNEWKIEKSRESKWTIKRLLHGETSAARHTRQMYHFMKIIKLNFSPLPHINLFYDYLRRLFSFPLSGGAQQIPKRQNKSASRSEHKITARPSPFWVNKSSFYGEGGEGKGREVFVSFGARRFHQIKIMNKFPFAETFFPNSSRLLFSFLRPVLRSHRQPSMPCRRTQASQNA